MQKRKKKKVFFFAPHHKLQLRNGCAVQASSNQPPSPGSIQTEFRIEILGFQLFSLQNEEHCQITQEQALLCLSKTDS